MGMVSHPGHGIRNMREDCPEIREFSAELGRARNPGHGTRNMREVFLSEWYLFSSLQDVLYRNVLCTSHFVVFTVVPLSWDRL